MSRYLCAGADQAYVPQLAGADVLISYAERTQHALIAERAAGRVGFLMLDNGAFRLWSSGKAAARVDDYVAFIHANRAGIDRAIALDVIPGARDRTPTPTEVDAARAATFANLDIMTAAGLGPDLLLPVLHFQDTSWQATLAAYRARGFDYIALGGTVGQDQAAVRAWVEGIVNGHRDVRFHLLGLSRRWALELPAASVDSTTWLQLGKNGLAKNRYLIQRLPGWFYHLNRRAVRLAGDATDLGEDVTKEDRRTLGRRALVARVAQASGVYLPPDEPAREQAATWMAWESGWCADDGEFNADEVAELFAEAEVDQLAWRCERRPPTRPWSTTRAAAPSLAPPPGQLMLPFWKGA